MKKVTMSGWRPFAQALAGIVTLFMLVFGIGALANAQNDTRVPSGNGLPNQNGHANQYLKTDGHRLLWSNVTTLSCPSCTTNALVYYNGTNLATPTNYLFESACSRIKNSSGQSLVLGAGLSLGYHACGPVDGFDGTYATFTNGRYLLIQSGSTLVDTTGGEWKVAGLIESTANGYKFPDGTMQTTAFVPLQITPSTIDAALAGFLVPQDVASNNSTGESWMVTKASHVTGIRFCWAGSNTSITVKLWSCTVTDAGVAPSGCTLITSATNASVNAGNGQTISFASTAINPYVQYATTMYDNNLGHITQSVGGSARQANLFGGGAVINAGHCLNAGPNFLMCRTDLYGAGGGGGGAPINGGGGGFYAEPVIVTP